MIVSDLYSNDADKVCKSYSCLKLPIKAHSHVGFLKILQSMFHLTYSIDIENCCKQAEFLNKEIIMKYLVVKPFA